MGRNRPDVARRPFRLGLTATYPEAHEQTDGRWHLDDLIGPIVYTERIDDLVGAQLAEYRTERMRIDLTPDERARYDADFAIYSGFFRSRQLQRTHGAGWLMELMRLSAFDTEARRALLARQRMIDLLAGAEGKLKVLDNLLREYFHEQTLVFTETNAAAYAIARRHLIPVITHETKAAERKHILDAFQAGHYRAIVTSRVLNEGVDVPEAKIAVVLGGTASAREYIQRLGRVLRKIGNRQAVLFEVIARDTRRREQSAAPPTEGEPLMLTGDLVRPRLRKRGSALEVEMAARQRPLAAHGGGPDRPVSAAGGSAALCLGKRARSLRGRAHRLHRLARAGESAGRCRDLHPARHAAPAGRIAPADFRARPGPGVMPICSIPRRAQDVLASARG